MKTTEQLRAELVEAVESFREAFGDGREPGVLFTLHARAIEANAAILAAESANRMFISAG
jgi:hypothetical protein